MPYVAPTGYDAVDPGAPQVGPRQGASPGRPADLRLDGIWLSDPHGNETPIVATTHSSARLPRLGSLGRHRWLWLSAATLAIAAISCQASPSDEPASPTASRWGIFAFPRDGLTAQEQIQKLESEIGRQFGAQRVYSNMNRGLPTPTDVLVRNEGRILYHNINSFHPVGGRKLCYRWSDIAAGRWDAMLVERANEIRDWGYPIIMSFTHEPNVNTAVHPLCGTASEYQAAFDHVVSIFDQQGATNVTWAWVLTAANFNGADGGPAVWEPQRYDIVGVDGYNHVTNTWRTPLELFRSAEAFALSRGKPLMIGEVGCEERPGDPTAKANWITGAATLFASWRVAVVFWTHTGNGGEWWLDSSPQALSAFAAAGRDPYFR